MDLAAKKASLKVTSISDKIEATFGPNPCTTLHLQTNDGDHLYLTCDRKRCVDCGPRKEMTIWLQTIQEIGPIGYVDRIQPGESLEEFEQGLQRAKKEAQRGGEPTTYQVVGDSTLGRIILSTRPLTPNARRMNLDEWRKRVIDMYHHSVQRIRRSYALGRVSLVTLYRKGKSGQASPWWRRSVSTDLVDEASHLNWGDMLAEIEWKEGVLLRHKPHPTPDASLPIPF